MLRKLLSTVALASLLGYCLSISAERINQEGRILGPPPVVTNAVLFNTPEADAILSAMQVFPVTNPWNEDISRRPVLGNSDAMIAQIIEDLSTNHRTLRVFFEMNFVVVPDAQPLIPINFVLYGGESDPSPYPIPANLPIEGWPTEVPDTPQEWQQDIHHRGGDRHAIIVQPGTGACWEMWQAKLTNGAWRASNGAKFDLASNDLRPTNWTSGDAAGLPMFSALPRFDECERGVVEHACRIVVARSRQEYIYPARHWASSTPATETNVLVMGQRVRLKSGFAIAATWAKEETALLVALKKYGALVADNGNFFSISVPPDDRWPANAFRHISSISITNFEVIETTGPDEGPRSAGAPLASAGADQSAPTATPVNLQGAVSYSGTPPTVRWRAYSGPGTVIFGNPAQTNTTAVFSTPGLYTLMLSADDAIHAVAYDAVVITVTPKISLSVSRAGTEVTLSWSGGSPPYVVEQAGVLLANTWSPFLTTNTTTVRLPITPTNAFFRIKAQ